jgi:membrane-associated phospholipid phosphatase
MLIDVNAETKYPLNRSLLIILVILLPALGFSQSIDIRLLRSLNSGETLNSDKYFRFISNSDAYVVIGTPAIVAGAGLIKKDDKMVRNACVMAAASILNAGLTNALKYTIGRDRPWITWPDIVNKSSSDGPSFPSSHTSTAFANAASLSLAYPEWYIIVPSFAYAGTVAYSRIHLGAHYPTDVAAGALIGAGCAYLTFKVNKALQNKNKHPVPSVQRPEPSFSSLE